ncbi:DUF3822 family protein [Fulvivirga sp. M361]|uniref:DUF3822 family protein n=1 Tax=Fulvivirga sp. M361 TaxID=2594266 RepID=UPI001179EF39|nr:DUF3822 family protein [Fulvivirga sp. M361]TRX49835.1 DUF3822 family protein [Fulvivirga sp. M361]
MNTTTSAYKLIKKIKNDKFDVDSLHHYNLLVQIGTRDLQVCVIDSRSSQCLLLEDFALAGAKTHNELQDILVSLFADHDLLMAGFWRKVRISIKNSKFCLVPSSLFVSDASLDYLKLNCQVNESTEKVLSYKHIKSDAVCVFAMKTVLIDWIESLYPNAEVEFIHQASALIEGTIHNAQIHRKDSLYLYIDRFKLHLITLKNGKLEYYNQFSIKQFSDYIRYIMLVMNGLNRNQKTTDLVLWGYIGKQSPHYNEFYKYIKNISFGDRPDYLKYNYMFDEIQDHHFFDLYSTHLCD